MLWFARASRRAISDQRLPVHALGFRLEIALLSTVLSAWINAELKTPTWAMKPPELGVFLQAAWPPTQRNVSLS